MSGSDLDLPESLPALRNKSHSIEADEADKKLCDKKSSENSSDIDEKIRSDIEAEPDVEFSDRSHGREAGEVNDQTAHEHLRACSALSRMKPVKMKAGITYSSRRSKVQ